MELRDLETFGEPGAVVYLADCVELMRLMPPGSVDAIFADPPYRLSNGGVTTKNGQVGSVDKGAWDHSLGSFEKDHAFNERWLGEAHRILKPGGTIWVSGTHHAIFSIGFALQTLGFKMINSVAWEKPDPPPNALHTAFTHPKAVEVRKRADQGTRGSLLQVERRRHRRVVGRRVFLALVGVVRHGRELRPEVDVAVRLREPPLAAVSGREALHGGDDLVEELGAAALDAREPALLRDERREVEQAGVVALVRATEPEGADLAAGRAVEDERGLRLGHVVEVPEHEQG
ncbi:MAG: hypothetical protein M3151_03065, partial [Actinomycetota bacterium]|nr:hypothetical protein [Actinomycetota bacterium]